MFQARILPFLLIFLINTSYAAWFGEITESNTAKAIADRLKPISQVTVEGAAPAAAGAVIAPGDIAKNRYETSCKVCHGTGVAGAPKFRSADWKPRMSVGIAGLLAVAIKGKGGMPPRGTCMSCTDDEIKATIEYMLPK